MSTEAPSAKAAMPGLPPRLATVSTVDALATDITGRILGGQVGPGVQLRESALAREYGVSRHTLRAALARLTGTGLLVFNANRGWSVPQLTRESFDDIAFLRIGLEVQALRELAARGEQVGPEARVALDEMLTCASELPWVDRLIPDMAFHKALVDQAGSQRLSSVYADTQLALHLYLVERREWFEPQSIEEWRAHHVKLVDAIESGDPDLVERCLRHQFAYDAGS